MTSVKSNSPQMSRVYSKRIGRPPNVPPPEPKRPTVAYLAFLDPKNFYPWEKHAPNRRGPK